MSVATTGRFRNRARLIDHGDAGLRQVALDLAEVGLAALSPAAGLARRVTLDGDELSIGHRRYLLSDYRRIVVLGAGKASADLALGVEKLLGRWLSEGIVVVPRATEASSDRITFIEADHPLPTEDSTRGARAILEAGRTLGPRDLAICIFTGGSSALASLPPEGAAAADKRQLHQLLLSSGMSIVDVNTVRKHVSAFKGGRLAAAIAPARILNLTVSDVVGDPLDCITDPTVQDSSTVSDAVGVLEEFGLLDRLPQTVHHHLMRREGAESPDLSAVDIESVIVTRGQDGSDAVAAAAPSMGFDAISLGGRLEGEASTVGRVLATLAGQSSVAGTPWPRRSVLVACGGECTVTLGSEVERRFGLGGPNQEAAIGAALAFSECRDLVGLFMDTDGSDGGAQVAGGLVDCSTAQRARLHGILLREALVEHDSTRALRSLGDAVVTGPTLTNANDLVLILIG